MATVLFLANCYQMPVSVATDPHPPRGWNWVPNRSDCLRFGYHQLIRLPSHRNKMAEPLTAQTHLDNCETECSFCHDLANLGTAQALGHLACLYVRLSTASSLRVSDRALQYLGNPDYFYNLDLLHCFPKRQGYRQKSYWDHQDYNVKSPYRLQMSACTAPTHKDQHS